VGFGFERPKVKAPGRRSVARGLEVSGFLQVTIDDRTIDVTAEGSRVRAEIGDMASGRPSLRLAITGFTLVKRLARALDDRALSLLVTRDGRPVLELGSDVRSGTLARIFGVRHVRIVRDRT
jgi:hypothetical protein